MLVWVVYGTRPEALKVAPIVAALRAIADTGVEVRLICTGQHSEMLDGALDVWRLVPDHTLRWGQGSQAFALHSCLQALLPMLESERPDVVVVQGDTMSALAAALQAHLLHIPVAHVEAGLRSDDLWHPWPEEGNRRMIDAIASLHFAPTERAAQTLRAEGHVATTHTVGNTVVDALMHCREVLDGRPAIRVEIETELGFSLDDPYVLFTQHRREAFGVNQLEVFSAVADLAKTGVKVIFPVHLNPRVRGAAEAVFPGVPNVHLLGPQPYLRFVELLRRADLVISDSGGIQEEAPTFGVHVLVTRLTTERQEGVEAGVTTLVGFDRDLIVEQSLLRLNECRVATPESPFGDGRSGERIARILLDEIHSA